MHYTLLRRGTCFDPLDPSLESTVSPTSIHSPQQATTNYLLTSLFLRSLVMLPDQLMEYPNRMQWFCRRRKHKGPIRTTESTQDLGEPPANILLHAIVGLGLRLPRYPGNVSHFYYGIDLGFFRLINECSFPGRLKVPTSQDSFTKLQFDQAAAR
jgi:hypothetical protein